MADAKKINALHAKGLTPPEIAARLMCGLQVVTVALTWTDQRVAEMARRAAEGQSAQAIADALGLPYCAEHAARAYVPAEKRDKNRRGGEAALDALARARGERFKGRKVA